MAHYDLLPAGTYPGAPGTRASVPDLIRSSLRRAFPPPAAGPGEDERFRRLLEALARRRDGHDQAAARAGSGAVAEAERPRDETLDDWVLVSLLVGAALGSLAAAIGGAYGISLVLALLP